MDGCLSFFRLLKERGVLAKRDESSILRRRARFFLTKSKGIERRTPLFDELKRRTRLFPIGFAEAEGAGFSDTEGAGFAVTDR